ncbi:hypothetical protein NDU88_005708 [Pleurodeles waltl]|uniref:Uncharacterized protein n=1 Tax=Pleurodeles waltl TaxID=8319 RepID=A0AAV7L8C2_PLEWA|nr:hypothetical protein NDU88_005708 [Pleurodeles waltl]
MPDLQATGLAQACEFVRNLPIPLRSGSHEAQTRSSRRGLPQRCIRRNVPSEAKAWCPRVACLVIPGPGLNPMNASRPASLIGERLLWFSKSESPKVRAGEGLIIT